LSEALNRPDAHLHGPYLIKWAAVLQIPICERDKHRLGMISYLPDVDLIERAHEDLNAHLHSGGFLGEGGTPYAAFVVQQLSKRPVVDRKSCLSQTDSELHKYIFYRRREYCLLQPTVPQGEEACSVTSPSSRCAPASSEIPDGQSYAVGIAERLKTRQPRVEAAREAHHQK
jgi:hypothetical protein